MPAIQRKNWVFTLPKEHMDPDVLKNKLDVIASYAIVGLETAPTTGLKHYQGYMQLKQKRSLFYLKQNFTDKAHMEVAKGTGRQNKIYCSKENVFLEIGQLSTSGQSHELQVISADFKLPWHELMEKYIQNPTMIKNLQKIRVAYREFHQLGLRLPNPYEEFDKPVWVDDLELSLNEQPRRNIDWLWSEEGNTGKTAFCYYLLHKHPKQVFYSPGAKMADFAYAYSGEPYVIFDIPRDKQDYLQYSILEGLCNGVLFSSKYESGLKYFAKPKILVVANFQPDTTKISWDRIRCKKI